MARRKLKKDDEVIEKPPKEELEELKFLQQQEVALVREMALEDFWFFVTNVLWPQESTVHLQESFHKPIADNITNSKPGCRDLLLAQRMSRKTMLRTVAHACWRILKDPNIRILVVSALDATAQDFVSTIKRQFQQNKGIEKYFPQYHIPSKIKLGTQYEFTHPARTNINLIDPTVRSTYLGAPFAGRRCDILIMDDPQDDKHVATPDQADKSLKNVNALFPLVDKNKQYDMIFVNGTRKGHNDIYGAMMGESSGSNVELQEPPFKFTIRRGLEGENGEADINGKATFDKVLTRDVLMQELARCRMDPKMGEEYWWREFMNLCQSPTSKKFLEEWFAAWVPQLPSNIVWSGILIDSAVKDKQVLHKGDFVVALVAHFDTYGHLYLTDGIRSDSLKTMELMQQLATLAQRANGVFNIVKEKVGEEMFFGACEDYFHRMRLPCTTYALSVRQEGKKLIRIMEALQAPFQARKIHFVGDGKAYGFPVELWAVLKDELTHLGQWSHDDAADALSLAFHRDIRIIPASRRASNWKPMYNARLPQPSMVRTNQAAMNMRQRSRQEGDGSMRGTDPFVQAIQSQLQIDMRRPLLKELPMKVSNE